MRLPRLLLVVLGVALAGAVMGAISAMVVVTVVVVAMNVSSGLDLWLFEPVVHGIAAILGGAMGAVLGPAASFGFLRHAPLWRIFAEGSFGTIVASVATAFATNSLLPVLVAGVVGFLLAGARLAVASRRGAGLRERVKVE